MIAFIHPHLSSLAIFREEEPKRKDFDHYSSDRQYLKVLKQWQLQSLIGHIKEPGFKVGDTVWEWLDDRSGLYTIKYTISRFDPDRENGVYLKDHNNKEHWTMPEYISHYHPGQQVNLKDWGFLKEPEHNCNNCNHFGYAAPVSDQPYPEFWCGKGKWDVIENYYDIEKINDCEDISFKTEWQEVKEPEKPNQEDDKFYLTSSHADFKLYDYNEALKEWEQFHQGCQDKSILSEEIK